ncbi:MAG: fibronectin type III domain-containing protein [Clostridium perfringens]|nr:fibronectin type III domain-containing protein [Clostridium perfringens]
MKLKKIITMVLTTTVMLSSVSVNVFANVKQENTPINLQVPVLGYDDDAIVLTWEKGKAYENIVDYKIYANGKFIGSANENFDKYSNFTNEYIESFYESDANNFHTEIQMMSYRAEGLEADTEYTFTVTGVLANGKETEPCEAVVQKTTKTQDTVNILDFGARDTGRIIDYKGREEEIKANTKAIQDAIDACPEGGKVVIPRGIYTCGSIWLKSNMTLELQEGAVLSGSTNVDDYEQNYLLRDYSTDRRTWGLINAYGKDGTLENIRIVGQGTIDGNGWKYGSASLGYTTDVVYQEKDILDPKDEEYKLPLFAAGTNANVYDEKDENQSLGILAKDAVEKALAEGYTRAEAYSTRPTLMILKDAHNVYIEDVTLTNPAFHGISLGDCENIAVNSIKNLSYDNNNGDGIGIDSSSNVTVFNSFFDTGDDAINFASGLGALSSYNEAVSNVRIFNNFVRESHGGIIAAGSHTGAWFYDIVAEDNVSNLSDMPFRFKSNPVNGGGIKNVVIRDNAVANPTKQAFVFTTKYSDENQILQFEPSSTVAKFYGIDVKNVTVKADTSNKSVVPIKVEGSLSDGHNGINFTNVTFEDFNKGNSIEGLNNSNFKNIAFTGLTPNIDKQWTITNSIDLKFKGDTVKTSAINNAESKPYFEDSKEVIATANSNSVDLSWTNAKDDTGVSKYVILTYKGKQLLHESFVEGNITNYTETGLVPSVEYTFVVQAEDATGNRTEKGPSVTVTTLNDESVGGILEPISRDIDIVGTTGYTWTNISFYALENTSVRKYEIYVNGVKTGEILNPYIRGLIKEGKIQTNVSGLSQGSENTIVVKAVSDSGEVLEYNTKKATTWNAFDRFAPTWGENTVLNASVNNSGVDLSWSGATDDSSILGYRVYVNNNAIGEGFSPVNRNLTTKDTSYTLNDLEPGIYEIRVEAGDTWWRAESTESKIAAPTNWTNHGPTVTIEIK